MRLKIALLFGMVFLYLALQHLLIMELIGIQLTTFPGDRYTFIIFFREIKIFRIWQNINPTGKILLTCCLAVRFVHKRPIKEFLPKRRLQFTNWYMEIDGDGHPPLSDILSSVFNKVLLVILKIINDIDSYRVYGIFLAACLVGLIFLFQKFMGSCGSDLCD